MDSVDVVFEKFLGKGSFGSVSLYTHTNRLNSKMLFVAVKTCDQKHAKALNREFEILSKFKRCKRIVQCYGNGVEEILNEEGKIESKIRMEYAFGGSLRTLMNNFKDKKLDDLMIRSFTRMLLQGLATIHRYGYVHCDLKPENILVFPRIDSKDGELRMFYELKISDFGVSKKDGDNSWWSLDHRCVGTSMYMSPESYSHGETSKGVDLWSLGCVVLEMYTGKIPWWHKNYDVKNLLKRPSWPLILTDLPCDIKLFLMTCFNPEPTKRKDALTLLKQFFWRGTMSKFITHKVNLNDNPNDNVDMRLEELKLMFPARPLEI